MKTALVLSAGGMFGAYQAGAWRALAGRFQPDIVVGASAGALNAWAIAGGADPEALIREWRDPAMQSLARFRFAQAPWRGVFDSQPLHARIERLWSAYRPRLEVGITAVEIPRLRLCLFRGEEIGWQHLAASCAVLSCYEQIRIGGRLYTDGGLLGALPLWAATRMGATRVLAVNALPEMPSAAVRCAVRAIRMFSRPPAGPAEPVDVRIIAPRNPLGSLREIVFWKPAHVARWIEQGERDALEFLTRAV